MKLQLERTSIFKLNAARMLSVLAIAATTVSAIVLGAIPIRAEAASPVTLQCQVGTNSNGNTLTCNGITVDGFIALNCRSPNPIGDSNGVYVVIAATCTGTAMVAGTTVSLTLEANPLSVDSNSGLVTANSGGTSALTASNGLSSVTVTSTGIFFSLTQSPLTLNVAQGALDAIASVLGVGIAEIKSGQGGGTASVSYANSTFTIISRGLTGGASVPGIIEVSADCGSSVTLNLNRLFPITVPSVSCNAL